MNWPEHGPSAGERGLNRRELADVPTTPRVATLQSLAVCGVRTMPVSQVVGAGRGPLVRASLAAAAETGRRVRVYAVEKNPNAVVTLQSLVASEG